MTGPKGSEGHGPTPDGRRPPAHDHERSSSDQGKAQKPTGDVQPEPSVRHEHDTTPAGDHHAGPLPQRGGTRDTSPLSHEVLNRRVLISLLIVLTAAVIPMLRLFVAPLVVSVTFAALFYPLYAWFLRRFRGRRNLSSFVTCLVLLLGLLVPTYVVGHLTAVQTVDLYNSAEPKVREVIRKGNEGPVGAIKNNPIVGWLRLQAIDWQSLLQEGAKAAGRVGQFVVSKTSVGLLTVLWSLFVVFFALFYLFRDGEQLLERLRYLSPLRNQYEDMLIKRFLLISRGTIRGTLLIGVIQGVLGAVVFLIAGINTWLVWGFVMVVLSIVPFTGAWLVMVPAGVIQLAMGNTWQGIMIIAMCVAVVSTVDNILRPRLVGTTARMHDLIIFLSTIGGISVFGVLGFIVGPATAALFITVLDIYGLEFRTQLLAAQADRAIEGAYRGHTGEE